MLVCLPPKPDTDLNADLNADLDADLDHDLGPKLDAWCTEGFLFSIAHQVLWLDPMRFSAMYALRLMKYRLKGFRVVLVGVDRVNRCVDPTVHGSREVLTAITVALLLDLEREVADWLRIMTPPTGVIRRAYDALMCHTVELRTKSEYDVLDANANANANGHYLVTSVFAYSMGIMHPMEVMPTEFEWS